ncbi:type III restriction endonuclease subunit R, partial [Streptococcus suis]
PSANPEALKQLRELNLVTDGKEWVMPKRSFGRQIFERYLLQVGFQVDFPKLKVINQDTPMLEKLDGIIERAPHGVLIVSRYKQIVQVIRERHPDIGIWTGEIKEGLDRQVVVATNQ